MVSFSFCPRVGLLFSVGEWLRGKRRKLEGIGDMICFFFFLFGLESVLVGRI